MVDIAEVLPDSPHSPTRAEIKEHSKAQLKDLTAQATLKYSVKDYNAAAELYSQATELQAEINGEISSDNADLLYAYGRCLYHVAVKNSDVLGSKVAGEKREEGSKKSSSKKQKKEKINKEIEDPEKRIAEEVVTKIVEEKDGRIVPETEADKASKPYFQFTGDENWDTSDEEEEGAEENGEGAEKVDEEDDFVDAYEVLDLARVLLLKKIEEVENTSGKGKAKGESQNVRQLKERLADTYNLQAEISLEGERFPIAVEDFKSSLELKEALFPQESNLVAEAHYMLSLALEFSSVTQQKNENGEVETGTEAVVDEAMREEAVQEMEAAIASCKMRIRKEEVNSQNDDQANGDARNPKITKKNIDDVREVVREMEQRLVDLRQPPVSLNDPTGMGTIDGSNPLSGILGSILGESPAAQKARLEEASKGATDLTNLVKRKKPVENEASKAAETEVRTNGKRKVGLSEEVEEVGTGKRAKITDGVD